MSAEKNADDLLLSIGGCGRYQWRLVVTLHLLQILVVFSLNSNIIISATKEWRCADETICGRIRNVSDFSNSTHGCPVKQCKFTLVDNETVECERFQFHDNTTFVAEWGLVCGKSYIPTTIQSMDLAGVMVGHVISGQIADLVGRRIPLYATILCIMVFNLIGYFSVTWSMLAASRFLLGVGVSMFLTVSYSLSSEFTVNKWRVWAIGFPSWFVEVCMFSLFAWLLQDWRYILLMCALLGVPFLFTWRLIPESFRWYLAHDKIDKATAIIQSVADANGKQYPDLKDFNEINSGQTIRFYPGSLFFIFAGVAFISILCCLGLPETKDSNLSDKIVEESSGYAKIS
ncbi:ORCT-like protein [Mya arenaria]|uniref:ORCT-like protein n=1 Tax=Mya arenaria TaxID=6604 RepID=A0ABY7FQF1_MYAAR|nr:ORCT-like protein [Mya arenaria]